MEYVIVFLECLEDPGWIHYTDPGISKWSQREKKMEEVPCFEISL
jgi:hypothetical protein